MNKRVKRLWLKALRSGKYPQGKNALRADGSFCCLGVLCDLYRESEGGQWKGSFFVTENSIHSMSQLPIPVVRWAGLERSNPRIGDFDAIQLNDSGFTFAEIADKVDEYL